MTTLQSLKAVSNVVLFTVLFAFGFALWLGHGRLSPEWGQLLITVTIIALLLQITAGLILRPRHPLRHSVLNGILAAKQQQYAFGYWVTLAAFLSLFILTQLGQLSSNTAFFLIGPALIGPTIYTTLASLRRAK